MAARRARSGGQVHQLRPSQYNKSIYGIDTYGGNDQRRYFYDELDRLVEMVFEDGKEMSFEHDHERTITKVTVPGGKVTEYTYFRDSLFKEVSVKRPSEPDQVFTYSYDDVGRLPALEYPQDTEIVLNFDDGTDTPGSGWDANGRLLHLRYEKDGDLIRRFEYEDDDSGNRTSQQDVTPTKAIAWEYAYDWLDRLHLVKKADADEVANLPGTLPTVSVYEYDESDNRIELHLPQENLTFTYVVDDADNLVEIFRQEGSDPPVLVETFTGDADGNMSSRTDEITEETISYHWDDSDKLIRVSSDIHGPVQDNRYDAGGIRKRKRDKNGNSSREYTAGLVTAASKPGSSVSNAPTFSYIQGHQLLGFEKNGNFSYFLTDALSTVRDLVDDDGEVLASYEFDEYGQRLATNENGASSPKTFVGGLSVQDEVADTGLMLMGHRFYDPSLGRFLNRDPIGFAGGLNLFGYSGNNPLRFVDAAGLQPYAPPSPAETLIQPFNQGGGATIDRPSNRPRPSLGFGFNPAGIILSILLALSKPAGDPEDFDPCPDEEKRRRRLALGLAKYLDQFADEKNAMTWKDAPDPNNWWPFIVQNIADPEVRKLFLIEGVDVWPGISRAASGRGGPTDNELFEIYRTKADNVHWYEGQSGNYQRVRSPID